jgi:hypothetical protein
MTSAHSTAPVPGWGPASPVQPDPEASSVGGLLEAWHGGHCHRGAFAAPGILPDRGARPDGSIPDPCGDPGRPR